MTGFESRERDRRAARPGGGPARQRPARHGLLRARAPGRRGPHDRAPGRSTTASPIVLLGGARSRGRSARSPRRLEPNPDEDPYAIGPDFDDPELDKDLWRFRRIAARGLFAPGAYPSDITLVNWPQVDYTDAPVLEAATAARARAQPRFLHWMQTEGGRPGLRLRGDVVGDTRGRPRQGALRPRGAAAARAAHGASSRTSRSTSAAAAAPAVPRLGRRRATTGSTCTRPPAATPTSTSRAARSSSRSARSARSASRTCSRPASASAPRTSPTAPTACTRSSGTPARPRATSPRSAASAGPRRAPSAPSPALLARFQHELDAAGFERAWPEAIRAPRNSRSTRARTSSPPCASLSPPPAAPATSAR